jgi:putative tricarboxylic transport membrane protein
VGVMLTFGVIGYFMRKFDFSYVAFLIGFILVPEWERALQQVVIISENNPTMFFERPVAMALMALTFFVIGKTFWSNIKAGRDCRAAKAKASAQAKDG